MREIVISEVAGVNLEALDAELRTVLGAVAGGVSLRRDQVIVHLGDEADTQQVADARSLVRRHDPQRLSAAQQAEQQRTQRLKAAHADALAARQAGKDMATTGEQVALLQRRVAWLEQMLEALTGATE